MPRQSRMPRSRFLRSVVKTSEEESLSMPWTRVRPEEVPKPQKVVEFRRA